MYFNRLVMTCTIEQFLNDGILKMEDILKGVDKMLVNNWGELCEEDRTLQEECLKVKDKYAMYMGIYRSNGVKFWIMNEQHGEGVGRVATILLPEEY